MTVEPPLSRRIEELAGYDDAESEAAGLGGALAALGGEVTAVRSELGSLRSEQADAQAALVDARGVLESRLAVLEDTLDLMVERLESLARDGAGTTTDRLAELLTVVRRLEDRVERLSDPGEVDPSRGGERPTRLWRRRP